MKQCFVFRSMILLFFIFMKVSALVAAERSSMQNQTPFHIFEAQVYPFLQEKCAGCHGDKKFGAPQHSPRNDSRASYEKIRGYVHFSPDWATVSHLITFGGSRHCKDYTGDDSCGTDHNTLISTVRNWIDAEVSAKPAVFQKSRPSAKVLAQSYQENSYDTNDRFLKIIQVSASVGKTCVLFENGKAKCWGGENWNASLGIGTTSSIGKSSEEMRSLPYIMIKEPIKQISVGSTHSCVLLQNGKAKCWGGNNFGQLGVGSQISPLGKTQQEMESLPYVMINESIIQISVGGSYTCALLQSRKTKCWGLNDLGQLGIGSSVKSIGKTSEEMQSLPDVRIKEPIAQIAVGNSHACALLQNGKAKCWGQNLAGALGIGLTVHSVGISPQEMDSLSFVMIDELIIQISVSASHTCALLKNGKAKCWGLNNHQQLGIASQSFALGRTPQEMNSLPYVLIDEPIQYIVAGSEYTCALLQNELSTVKCWGKNNHGQLGIGITRECMGTTLQEMNSLSYVLVKKKVFQISMGHEFTCFLLENGKIKCAGENKSGQLGTGDKIERGVYDVDGTGELSDALVSAEDK